MSGRSHRFLGIVSTFWEVNVSCSRIQHGESSEDRTNMEIKYIQKKHVFLRISLETLTYLTFSNKLLTVSKKVGYSLYIVRQATCLAYNPILIETYTVLYFCTAVVQASDSMMASA